MQGCPTAFSSSVDVGARLKQDLNYCEASSTIHCVNQCGLPVLVRGVNLSALSQCQPDRGNVVLTCRSEQRLSISGEIQGNQRNYSQWFSLHVIRSTLSIWLLR